MKYIEKQTLEACNLFVEYYNEHNEKLQKEQKNGDDIWQIFGRNMYARKALQQSLLMEQGHICAFCGMRIWVTTDQAQKNGNFSVEHFLRKGAPENKNLTLNYTNLLGSCDTKEDRRKDIAFPIPEKPDLDNLQDIANYLEITTDDLIKYNNRNFGNMEINESIAKQNQKKPLEYQIKTITYKQNVHHCNAVKLADTSEIINPTTEKDCEWRFKYSIFTKNGVRYCKIEARNDNDTVAKNTIEILNLNTEKLQQARVEAYLKFEQYFSDIQNIIENIWEYDKTQLVKFINDSIKHDIYAKTNDRLDAYCFVTAIVFRQEFAAILAL